MAEESYGIPDGLDLDYVMNRGRPDKGPRIYRDIVGDFTDFYYTGKYIVQTPKRMNAVEWTITGQYFLMVAILEDDEVKESLHAGIVSEPGDAEGNLSSIFKKPGDAGIIPGTALAIYLGGLVLDSPHERETGIMLLESFAYTGLLTVAGQVASREKRPSQGGGMNAKWGGGHGVSGHVSTVASMAGPINYQYLRLKEDDNGWTRAGKWTGKVIVYGFPVGTAWSRMYDNKHYLWNTVLGLGIGYTIGELVANAHGKDLGTFVESKYFPDRLGITPVRGDGQMINLGWDW